MLSQRSKGVGPPAQVAWHLHLRMSESAKLLSALEESPTP